MRIIVAIDIIEGKCVRLTQGDYSTKKIYSADPLELARKVEDNGIVYLHLVDLDGAKNKKIINYKVLEMITGKTSLKVDFGGGIRSDDDLRIAFECGALQVTCGSIAVTNPQLFIEWLVKWGPEKIILGADFKKGKITTEGWMESSQNDIISFLNHYRAKGVSYTICTDIEKDGMLQGPSIDTYKEIIQIEGLNLIASGGISSVKDVEELREIGCEGAIIGKAVYEGRITLNELSIQC